MPSRWRLGVVGGRTPNCGAPAGFGGDRIAAGSSGGGVGVAPAQHSGGAAGTVAVTLCCRDCSSRQMASADSPILCWVTSSRAIAVSTSSSPSKAFSPWPENLPSIASETSIIRDYREAMTRYAAILGDSGRFDNWTGAVRFHVDGRHVAVSFFPDCQGFPQAIEFATANRYAFGLKDSNTMVPLHSPIAETLSRANANQTVVASGHLFYLAHGNMGNFSTGKKAELRQRYKSAPNYPPTSVALPHYLAAFDSVVLKR